MSIHGNQLLTPLFLGKDSNLPPIRETEEIALAFYLLTKDLKKEENILSFSRLLWPFLSIPGVISKHIILDGLSLLSKEGKLTNPPRQPLIGHLLRNVDNRGKIEELEKIKDVLTYKDSDAEMIGAGEESEYQTLKIQALVNPEMLDSLRGLIKKLENKPIENYMPLDTLLTTEKALNISEHYRDAIETMRGNSLRWETQIELIGKEVDKWLTDLRVQLKDIDSRYSSQITKTSSSIDDSQVREELDKKYDAIDQWKVSKKKKLIENITLLYKTIERHLEEMVKKNRFFTREQSLKSKIFEDLLPTFDEHFEYLKEQSQKCVETIDSLKEKYKEYKIQGERVEAEAHARIEEFEAKLDFKMKDRNKMLSEFEQEKREKIQKIEALRDNIEKLYNEITKIILNKKQDCYKEAENLKKWSINDNEASLFATPIQWFYMPVYAMFIEDEDMFEERMEVVFPGYIGSNGKIYENLSDAFANFKEFLVEKVDDDMKIRSNFEFSCENKNFKDDPSIQKKIQKGIANLKTQNIINSDAENVLRNRLKLLS